MHAEFQVISPLVPVRQVRFLRFCKQHADGVWAVVDVSIDRNVESSNALPFSACRRLPSGCIIQEMPNGCSKVKCFFLLWCICMQLLLLWKLRYSKLFK